MKPLLFFTILSFHILNLKGQNNSNPYQNLVILNHYSVQELQTIEQTDSVKFNAICYFYTKSFVFEEMKCSNCISIDENEFDITEYEYLRLKDKRFTRHFEKYGFKLTLLSINELTYKLPIHFTK